MKRNLTLTDICQYLPHSIGTYNTKSKTLHHRQWYDVIEFCIWQSIDKPLLKPLSKFTDQEWGQIFTEGVGIELPENTELIRYDNEIELILWNRSYTYSFEDCQFDSGPWKFNQLAAFTEIHRLHGDTGNLIGHGLALDVTEVGG